VSFVPLGIKREGYDQSWIEAWSKNHEALLVRASIEEGTGWSRTMVLLAWIQ
jgi:hypothetical protein